jgi:mono/diheme cytochrome c family protein
MKKGPVVAIILMSCLSSISALRAAGDAAKGEQTFKAQCVICHGEKGHGDGAAAAALNPKPRNFSSDEFCKADAVVLKTSIKNGKNAMPPFGSALSAEQIEDVFAYVRNFCPKAAK